MKKLSIFLVAFLISTIALFSSFKSVNYNSTNPDPPVANEFDILVKYLESNGNFINSTASPAFIDADVVKKNMKNAKYHLIDIRSESKFEAGHIKNSNLVKPTELLSYFDYEIDPAEFDKIVIICYSGQTAAYYTSLLRLAGYGNVYSMKWGMSAWRLDFADASWNKALKSDYASKLGTANNPKAAKGSKPVLKTGESSGKDILTARLEKVFVVPYKESSVKSSVAFSNPGNYYIVSYRPTDRYNKGHVPKAINYKPNASMSSTSDLYTLPTNKEILVTGSTGQGSAYVTAYLDLLGYDASNLSYGANGYMYKTVKGNGWDAFSKKEINMYPVVE